MSVLSNSALARVFLFSLGILSAQTVHAQVIVNAEFELPLQSDPGSFEYGPSQPAATWTFDNRSGISGSTGPWAPPDGALSQFAFLQVFGGGEVFFQSIAFSTSGEFALSYLEGTREGYSAVVYNVTLTRDSNSAVTFFASRSLPENQPFTNLVFNVTIPNAGNYTLAFTGVSSEGDGAAVFDNIAFTSAVPEPATYAIVFGVAALGLAVWKRQRNRQA